MSVRLMAVICVILTGFAIGAYRSERLKTQLEISRQTVILLRSSSILVRYRELDVYELVSELRQGDNLSSLRFLEKVPKNYGFDSDFREIWRKSVENEAVIPEEERKLLLSFGDIIGSCDTEGQLKEISALEREAETLEELRKENYIKKGKLYRSMGLLFGMMCAILVI